MCYLAYKFLMDHLIIKLSRPKYIHNGCQKNPRWPPKFIVFCNLLIKNQQMFTIKELKSVFNLFLTFWNKNNQNPRTFKGVMVLARNGEITEKQVFVAIGHEILIFQYYSKNKYCSDWYVTHMYEFLYKLGY